MELIDWISFLLPFLVACLVGVALPLIAVLTYKQLAWGLALIGATMVADVLLLSTPILRIGISMFVVDLPMVLLGLVAISRWLACDDVPRRNSAWLLLVVLFGLGLAIGLVRHGTAAGVAARSDFYSLAAASYAMSFPIGRREMRQLSTMIAWTALALLAITLYRWMVVYLPIRELLPFGGLYNNDGEIRVVWASATLLMAEAALLGTFVGRTAGGTPAMRWLAAPLIVCVLILQHRSVWLAALAGVLTALLLAGRQRASRFRQLVLALALAGTSVLPLTVSDQLATQFNKAVGTALAGRGTVHARFENWRITLENWANHGALAIAIGDAPGKNNWRTVETEAGELRRIGFSAHNHYVSLLTGSGVLGLLVYLWVVTNTLRGLIVATPSGEGERAESGVLLLLLVMQLVYFVSYGSDFVQFALFGVAMAWVASHDSKRSRPTAAVQLHGQPGPAQVMTRSPK